MAALDEIQTLLNAMRDRGAELAAMAEANIVFKNGMASMASSIADMVGIMEQMLALEKREAPEPGEMAIAAALDRLTIAIATEKEDPPPNIIVNVPPAQVTIQSDDKSGASWKIDLERAAGIPGSPIKAMTVTRI